MTVDALMAMIPQSRTAFYKYFDDVHGLMAEMLKRLETEILAGGRVELVPGPIRRCRERAYCR
jgi:AcrR family transcriptional regulator